MCLTKREARLIESAVFPILVEVKSQYIKNLPGHLSLRDKRERMHTLNKAADQVLNTNVTRFDIEE